jgi:hypothetical protein
MSLVVYDTAARGSWTVVCLGDQVLGDVVVADFTLNRDHLNPLFPESEINSANYATGVTVNDLRRINLKMRSPRNCIASTDAFLASLVRRREMDFPPFVLCHLVLHGGVPKVTLVSKVQTMLAP